MCMSSRHKERRGIGDDARGMTLLLATIATIIVLLLVGIVMTLMALSVTPISGPEIVMLSSNRQDPGNYSISVVAMSSPTIERGELSVIVHPDDPGLMIGNLTGSGEYLSQGDSVHIGNLESGSTYTVNIVSSRTGSTIGTLTFLAT